MAAGCGYHSPQFSEDITWLPAWLQPHQLSHFADCAKDEQVISLAACKNQDSFQENTSDGQVGQLFTRDDAKYSSCHLYLSGGDNSPAENTPSSGQALHFHLHLSSAGISQLSSGQLHEIPQTGSCETIEGSFRKPPETPVVNNDINCQYKMDDAPVSESPVGCKPRMSHILISQSLIKADQNNWQEFQGKLDAGKLGSKDIDVEVLQTEKCENEGLSRKPIPETPAVQNDTCCRYKTDNSAPASDSLPVGCKSRILHVPVSEPLIKAGQNNRQRFHGKLDAGNLRTADINDAVELSVAASEAMVISEMVSSSFASEFLPTAAILEIALRVKQARKQCYSNISGADSLFSTDEVDETNQLCDLDEDIMADAFHDVGLSVTQIVGTPKNVFCSRKSPQQQQILQSDSSCDLNRHVSESHCGRKGETQRKRFKAQDVDINRTISQTNDAFADELQSKNLPLERLSVQHTRSTALLPMDSITSCLRNQSMVHTHKLTQNADALTTDQMDSKDDQAILKESKVAPERDTNIRKNMNEFFNGESSFISESMDVMDECTLEQRLKAESEIVASSSTPFKALSRRTYKEIIHEEIVSSQDIVRSSLLSLVDPLCSIVPCSISSDDGPMNEIGGNGEKFINSTAVVGLQNLIEKTTMPNAQETLPSKPLDQGGECVFLKMSFEGSGVPTRKQFNSLKPYSMVMPCQNTAGEIVCHNEPIPLHSMDEKIMHLFPTEKNTNSFACNKDESRLRLKSIDKYVDLDGPNNSQNLESKGHEKVDVPYAVRETKDDDIWMSVHHNEGRFSSLILNNKKHRLRACKIILNTDGEDEMFKRSSASNMTKYRSENSMNEVSFRDQTNTTSYVPQQSNLRSHPANKHRLLDKKVRFLEPKSGVDRTKTGGRLQSGYKTCSSQRRTRKRVKESSLEYKSESGKEIYNSLTSCHMMHGKGMIFQGLEFLLTGFSSKKEKELEVLIRKYGGYVLSNIPSFSLDLKRKRRVVTASLKLPIVLSPKQVQTTKFLYGCATNTWILNANWLADSVHAGSVLPPGKYITRPIQTFERNYLTIIEPLCFNNHPLIFGRVGIMLYGKASFCTKFSKIIQHGGGQVFKSLQRLVQSLKNGKITVGTIVVENEGSVSRHLKHCALEHNLQTMPASWIVNSLFSGKLLPFKKDRCAPLHRIKMPTFPRAQDMDMSEEI